VILLRPLQDPRSTGLQTSRGVLQYRYTDISYLICPFLEKEVLAHLVEGVVWYTPTNDNIHRYGDGGVAIIDQWIASHAKFFTGKW
jgi:hypothetical protein